MYNGSRKTDGGDKGERWRRRGGDEKAFDALMPDEGDAGKVYVVALERGRVLWRWDADRHAVKRARRPQEQRNVREQEKMTTASRRYREARGTE
ncbi:hypothetical protein E2C01_086400 [Portunus trituberculatus]|uniref:Uncharacterized protein n=1 Tax=Portunus trituberculatus TaxID=210409 RepID=A0A5B7J965_PORTR|nr:hypothetical protein [Portunus trituberculatus]